MEPQLQPLLGQRLKAARESKRWTQADLAAVSGVSSRIISYLETGERLPTLEHLAQLARGLGVSIHALVDLEAVPIGPLPKVLPLDGRWERGRPRILELPYQQMGKLLRESRKTAGWTTVQVAATVGVTVWEIRDLERGARPPQLVTAVKLSRTLGVSLDEIAGLDSVQVNPLPVRERKRSGRRRGEPKAKEPRKRGRPKHEVFTPEQKAEIVRLYTEEGRAIPELAEMFSVSLDRIHGTLKKEGVQLRSVGRPRKHPLPDPDRPRRPVGRPRKEQQQ